MSNNDDFKQIMKDLESGDEGKKKQIKKALQAAGQKWLSDKAFAEQFEKGMDRVRDRGDEELSMMFVLYGRRYGMEDGEEFEVMPVLLPDWNPESEEQKRMIMKALGAKFAEEFPDHMLVNIVHTSEAWQSMRQKDQPDEDLAIAPSDSPNRIEVVMVSAMSMDQRQSWYTAEILKDKDGKFTGLKKMIEERYPQDEATVKNFLSASIYMGHGDAKRKAE